MTKNQYLSTSNVMTFVEWMSANLDSNTFAHGYINRKTGKLFSCNSLYEAFTGYHWPHPAIPRISALAGTTFATNALALNALRVDLNKSIIQKPNDTDTCSSTADVMTWGGVRAGNVRWLNANKVGLVQLLLDTRNAIDADNARHPTLTNTGLRFNAGMTKVYSLICQKFVIYDSRVAAALGWAVVKFCHEKALPMTPPELSFPWAPAKESSTQSNPKKRNPSELSLEFPRLKSGPLHAEWNLKASWLLEAVLQHPNAKGSKFLKVTPHDTALRALEAALFMIGYDLTATTNTKLNPAQINRSAAPTPDTASQHWNECWTLIKKKPFQYQITTNSIEIENGRKFSDTDINATLQALWIEFNESHFPLANSATLVRNGTAPKGLGRAYFETTGKNPPDSSKLAAILEELGIIIPYTSSPKKRGIHWMLNTSLLGLSAKTPMNIRAVLNAYLEAEDQS